MAGIARISSAWFLASTSRRHLAAQVYYDKALSLADAVLAGRDGSLTVN